MKTIFVRACRCLVLATGIACLQPHLFAIDINPNDILVSIGNSVGGAGVQYNSVREFTLNGTLVQTIPFNYNGGTYPNTEYLRDIAVSSDGSIQAYNGTFAPFMTTYSPTSNTFTHRTFDGWNTVNNVTYGGIATYGNFVYATDMQAGSGQANGIVRFDLSTNTATRFADGFDFIDLNIGLDGKLYGFRDRFVYVYDPITLGLLRTIALPESIYQSDPLRSIAVDQNGRLFVSGLGGTVYRFDPNGNLQVSAPTGFGSLTDIDIDELGRLILGQEDGRVIMSDSNLSGFTSFLAINDPNVFAWTTFVSFAKPIPEPSSLWMFVVGLGISIVAKRRVRRRDKGYRLGSSESCRSLASR